jgi:aryl-phospho-beta-D-glucosidase BglC (GH1 family)
MYVIINIHYDDGWLDCTAVGANQDTVRAKQKALWEQIATTFRDYDEHLMFASANEPNATDAATINVLMSYHQTFINAVRSTGGKNAYRNLIIQSGETSIDLANQFLNPANVFKPASLPSDAVPNRMMLEVHDYGPPNFALLSGDASWGPEWYFWGANYHTTNPLFLNRNSTPPTEESYYDSIYHTVKTNFFDKGIPVIMGEFDAVNHSGRLAGYPQDSVLSLNSRAHMFRFKTQTALANGIIPFVWAGGFFDRATLAITDQQSLDSLRAGTGR